MGVFDATQAVVNQSAGVIIGETSMYFDTLIPDLESTAGSYGHRARCSACGSRPLLWG